MKKIIQIIARALVDQPESVVVAEIAGTYVTIIELSVAREDIGKIIGKQGRTASALQTILNAVSSKAKKRSRLEIIE